MELLPWKEGESAEKVLVKGKDLSEETVSRSFSLARLLRDAGYMVELGFDECKEAGYRWFVSVFDVDSFSIMDCERQQTLQVNSEEEILAAIRG